MSSQLEVRCFSCSVLSVREARFCRQCGALLRKDNLLDGAEISPDALTVELHEPKRQTTPLPSLEERATGPQTVVATAEVGMGAHREESSSRRVPVARAPYAIAALLMLALGLGGITLLRRSRHRLASYSNSLTVAKLDPLLEPRAEVVPSPADESVSAGETRVRIPVVYRPASVPGPVSGRVRRPYKIVQITKAHPSRNDYDPGSVNQTARLSAEARPTLTIRGRRRIWHRIP